MSILVEQLLNGVQFGVMLFLMAAGLTLVFGIMNLVNLAHGSLYMVGAYVCAWTFVTLGSFVLAVAAALVATLVIGVVVEIGVFRPLYKRDHLDQVLATFGLVLIFNEAVRFLWGPAPLFAPVPEFLSGRINILPSVPYPTYRIAIIVVGLLTALALYILLSRTRIGMMIRAGASNRRMAEVLGVDVYALYTIVFALGAALAGLAGLMAGPILTVSSGMGDGVLILAFVVIVIGGIGSVRGAFIAALLVGFIDTLGRAFLRSGLALIFSKVAADNAAPAIASMLVYVLMAAVLYFRPQGLFPPKVR